MESFDFSKALSESITGQKRTAARKQHVFFYDDIVIKGPYKKENAEKVFERAKVFRDWETPCVVLPLEKIERPEGIFISFPNLMKDYELSCEDHKESFGNQISYKILKDPPVYNINQAIKTGEKWIFEKDKIVPLLLGLCHCFLLNVGDMNLRNILVDSKKKLIYIIDYDENRTAVREDGYFYFNNALSETHGWSQAKRYYKDVAQLLNIEHIKTQTAITLLRTYDETPKAVENTGLGQMIYKGIRGGHSKTFRGIDFDVAKSALQKYIRRRETDKAIKVATELYRFTEIPEAKACVTNTFNRVAIIAAEDIGPSKLSLVIRVIQEVEKGNRNFVDLITMVHLLSISPKTRIMSHLWWAYANSEGRKMAREAGLVVDDSFKAEDREYIINQMKDCYLFLDSDPSSLRPYIVMFDKRLSESDYNAYTWASFYLNKVDGIKLEKRKKYMGAKNRSTTKPDILLWKVLSKYLSCEIHDTLIEAYYNHTENRPFLAMAIIVAIRRLGLSKFNYEEAVERYREKGKTLDYLLRGKYNLVIDDYAIDKHTMLGRRQGKTLKDFVLDGAKVIPQDPEFYDQRLEELYQNKF